MGTGTDVSFTNHSTHASTRAMRGESPFHTRGTKPRGFPSSEASSTEGYHQPLQCLRKGGAKGKQSAFWGTQREDAHHAFTYSSCLLDPKESKGLTNDRDGPHDVFRLLQLVRSLDTPSEPSKLLGWVASHHLKMRPRFAGRSQPSLLSLGGVEVPFLTPTIEATARRNGFTPT